VTLTGSDGSCHRAGPSRPLPGAGPSPRRHPSDPPGLRGGRSWLLAVARTLLLHPALWGVAVRQVGVLAPRGWWRRAPFLPLPDPSYLRFRLVTAYGGDGSSAPSPDDVLAYLRWCRRWRAVVGSGG
jgi:hypothetical protein